MGHLRTTAATIAGGSAFLLAMTACGVSSRDSASAPPPGSSALVVLDTYLDALVAGDCVTVHAAAAPTFSAQQGNICGQVDVSAFSVRGDPATPRSNDVIYATILTTKGSADGTIAPGETMWFYKLTHQKGEWRLVSGGSGP